MAYFKQNSTTQYHLHPVLNEYIIRIDGKRKMMLRENNKHKNKVITVRKPVFYVLITTTLLLFIFAVKNTLFNSSAKYDPNKTQRRVINSPKICETQIYCSNVLTTATRGQWIKSNNTELKWKQDSTKDIRKTLNLPSNMTRFDMRCGISFPLVNTRLPAHCDPEDGELYCCVEASGWCGNTPDHCLHSSSFHLKDHLSPIDAVWVPTNHQCKLKSFSIEKACSILNSKVKKIVFLGDSQARHFFTAFILFLSNNYKNGAIHPKYQHDKKVLTRCSYEYQVLNNDCRHFLVHSTTEAKYLLKEKHIKFELEYFLDYRTFVSKVTEDKYKSMYTTSDTYLIISAGSHFNSDHQSFIKYYLKYMLDQQKQNMWPKFIIETLPQVYSPTATRKRHEFNENVIQYGKQRDVTVIDNFQLSKYLESFDGRTYGLKFNLLKVEILLNYFYNIRDCDE